LSAAGAVAAAAGLAVAGCGGSNAPKAPPGVSQSAFERQLADAQRVNAADFPAASGRKAMLTGVEAARVSFLGAVPRKGVR
jgi:hypothetical protein